MACDGGVDLVRGLHMTARQVRANGSWRAGRGFFFWVGFVHVMGVGGWEGKI